MTNTSSIVFSMQELFSSLDHPSLQREHWAPFVKSRSRSSGHISQPESIH